ncbi:hypothetical protein PQQ64_25600 [Paraburkholderia graminis]|uniref:hypothetical protein n=1 Tax=Paraburkholderia graminis TaxID=60548 RepID=UPI0038B8863B
MATVVRNVKIPATTLRVSKAAADEAMLRAMYGSAARKRGKSADAVAPSVMGLKGVKPSTKGIAANARFAQLAKVAKVAADGLSAIQTIRDSAEAAANPELAALANDPKLMAVIGKVVEKIIAEVNSLTAPRHSPLNSVRMSAEEKAHHIANGGADAAFIPLTAEDMAAVERAREKLARLQTADALGDAGDIVAARFGYEPRAYDADDMDNLIDRLSGKTK